MVETLLPTSTTSHETAVPFCNKCVNQMKEVCARIVNIECQILFVYIYTSFHAHVGFSQCHRTRWGKQLRKQKVVQSSAKSRRGNLAFSFANAIQLPVNNTRVQGTKTKHPLMREKNV